MKKYIAGLVAGAILGSAALVWAQTNVPISQLPPVPVLSGTELFPIVKSGITYSATPNQVRAVLGSPVNGTWTGSPIGSAYGGAGTVNGLLKANGLGAVSLAVAGVNYAPATTGASILAGNSAGGFTNVSIGSGLTYAGGTLFNSAGGTVTSVGLTAPSFLTVSGSPVTSSGTLALTLTSQTANQFLASPTGASGTPTMRSIASADLSGSFTGITGLGTISSGTWQGTAIGTGFGGLGLNNSAANGLPLFASGTVTMTNVLAGANGGMGVANTGKTITIGANLVTTGAGATTLAFSGSTNTQTFPSTSATIARTDAGQTFTGANTFSSLLTTAGITASSTIGGQYANPSFSLHGTEASAKTWIMQEAAGTLYFQNQTDVVNALTLDATGNATVVSRVSATGYKLNGNDALTASGNYAILSTSNAVSAFLAGNASDPSNYYRNTTHWFGNIGGGTAYADISATGIHSNNGLTVSGLGGGGSRCVTIDNSGIFSGAACGSFSSSTITATNANALAVGQNGTTNPAFNVDTATASSATGLNIKSAAAAGGVALKVLSSGTNEAFTIDAKGSGTLTINGTGTGDVIVATGSSTQGLRIGTTSNNGSLSNAHPVSGGVFSTATGSTGGMSLNTPVTMFTFTASGAYLVTVAAYVGAAAYSCSSVVIVDSGTASNALGGGGAGAMTCGPSGTNYQATQTSSGGTLTGNWSVLRLN